MHFDFAFLQDTPPSQEAAPLAECLIQAVAEREEALYRAEAAERAAAALQRSAAAAERAQQASVRAAALAEQAVHLRESITSALDGIQQDILEELLPKQLCPSY